VVEINLGHLIIRVYKQRKKDRIFSRDSYQDGAFDSKMALASDYSDGT